MENLEPGTLITLATIVFSVVGMIVGAILPALMEGRAVYKALEGMTRQPEAAGDIRGTLIVALALLETTAIYVLLVILILIFSNPLLERFFPSG